MFAKCISTRTLFLTNKPNLASVGNQTFSAHISLFHFSFEFFLVRQLIFLLTIDMIVGCCFKFLNKPFLSVFTFFLRYV